MKFEYDCKIIMNFENGTLPPKNSSPSVDKLIAIVFIAKVYIYSVRQRLMALMIFAIGLINRLDGVDQPTPSVQVNRQMVLTIVQSLNKPTKILIASVQYNLRMAYNQK